MVNYVDDPAGRGGEIETQKQVILQSVAAFQKDYADWNARRAKTLAAFELSFHSKLDEAFEHLQKMTTEIMACTDDELNAITLAPHASSVIATIKSTLAAFQALHEAAEATLRDLCVDSEDIAAKDTQFVNLRATVQQFIDQVRDELVPVAHTQESFWNDFQEAQNEFEDYERKIRWYDDLSLFEQVFTRNAHDQYDGAKNNAEQNRNRLGWRHTHMRELKELMQRIVAEMESSQGQTMISFDAARAEEKRVVDAKKTATEVYGKTYDLENLLRTREIEFSVEEAVRHVLQIVYTTVAAVDSDVHVRQFKGQILNEVAAKYGVDGAEELKKTKKYLEFEI